jgi:hypothetical protein
MKQSSGNADLYQVVIHVDAATLHGGDSAESSIAAKRTEENVSAETSKRARGRRGLQHDVDVAAQKNASAESRCEIEDGPTVSAATARRVADDASRVTMITQDGEPLALGRKTRQISTPLRRALKARDNECRFPGCHRHKHTEAHHIHHWADGGETNLDNLVTLCKFHHRLLHEGGFSIEKPSKHSSELIFRNRHGERIEPARPMPASHPVELLLRNHNNGIEIDLNTLQRYRWTGEVCDYSVFIDHLIKADKLAAAAETIPRKHCVEVAQEEVA